MKRLTDIVTNSRSIMSLRQIAGPTGGSRCRDSLRLEVGFVFMEHITSRGGFDVVDRCVFASMLLTRDP